jgi:CheY-like chemotaxis protein
MKILLVDDSKSARYALRLQLQRHGIDVATADSAESAFEMLKADLPDAILMDHMMPGLNGFEAFDIIRADARTADIPVVICTSHEDADFAAAAQRKGVVGILPKSAAPEKLPQVLALLQGAIDTTRVQPAPSGPSQNGTAPARRPVAADSGQSDRSVTDLTTLVEQRIQVRLSALLNPLIDDLRRDLAERLATDTRDLLDRRLAETRHQLEAKLADAHIEWDSARFAHDVKAVEAVVDQRIQDTLPDLLKMEVEAERAEILGLVDQYLKELKPRGVGAGQDSERFAALEGSIGARAQDAARRTVQDAIDSERNRANALLAAMECELHQRLRQVYWAIGGASLAGILAAFAVYLLC